LDAKSPFISMTSSVELFERCDADWPETVENNVPLSLSILIVKTYKQFSKQSSIKHYER